MNLRPLNVALLAFALVCAQAAHAAEPERNVFAPPTQSVQAQAAAATVKLPPAIPAGTQATLPPILPPPPLPPLPLEEAVGTAAPASSPVAADAKVLARPERRVFLSRQEIETQRSRCDISRKGSGKDAVSPQGGELTLRYALTGGRACLSIAASDANWAEVVRADDSQATVRILPNVEDASREVTVTVLTPNGKSAVYLIHQGKGSASQPAVKPTPN